MTQDSWEVFASISDRPKAERTPRARDIMQLQHFSVMYSVGLWIYNMQEL